MLDASPNPAGPATTFVCCVEAGVLEEQTLRMVASLRRWGGRFADSPVVAVTPRVGLPLTSLTLGKMRRLGVEHLSIQPRHDYTWYHFYNKPVALAEAERRAATPFMGWLDADLLFVGEPVECVLAEGEAFAACAPDKNIGTSGPGDDREPWWVEACRVLGLDINDLPWLETCATGERIRLHWNGGFFVYRRSTGFAQIYLNACRALLDARLGFRDAGVHFTEQASLGLAMFKAGLAYRALSHSHNYTMEGWSDRTYPPEELRAAPVLHYHNMMDPAAWPRLMQVLREHLPEVHDWLERQGPLTPPKGLHRDLVHKGLRALRARQRESFVKGCRLF